MGITRLQGAIARILGTSLLFGSMSAHVAGTEQVYSDQSADLARGSRCTHRDMHAKACVSQSSRHAMFGEQASLHM